MLPLPADRGLEQGVEERFDELRRNTLFGTLLDRVAQDFALAFAVPHRAAAARLGLEDFLHQVRATRDGVYQLMIDLADRHADLIPRHFRRHARRPFGQKKRASPWGRPWLRCAVAHASRPPPPNGSRW